MPTEQQLAAADQLFASGSKAKELAEILKAQVKELELVCAALMTQVLSNADVLKRKVKDRSGVDLGDSIEDMVKGPIRLNVRRLRTAQQSINNTVTHLEKDA
jgi:hypothetical protein